MGSPEVVVEGEVIEVDAPRRLVQTWHPLFAPETVAEPATRLTWEISDGDFGGLKLTLTHELDGAPLTAAFVAGAARHRRRLGLRAERPEDAARDRHVPRRLSCGRGRFAARGKPVG